MATPAGRQPGPVSGQQQVRTTMPTDVPFNSAGDQSAEAAKFRRKPGNQAIRDAMNWVRAAAEADRGRQPREMQQLLYVAVTRASDAVYLIGAP